MKIKPIILSNLIIIFSFILISGAGADSGSPFWSMYVGNSWTYSGNLGAYTYSEEVIEKDLSTCPVTTYLVEGLEDGSPWVKNWFEISSTYLKLWRLEYWDDDSSSWIKIIPNTGFTAIKNPITVSDSWTENVTGTVILGSLPPISSVSMTSTVTVVSYEDVTIPMGTYKAYRLHTVQNIVVPIYGTIVLEEYGWFVPYLGVIKVEEGGDSEVLTSMSIKKNTVDFNSNAKTDILWRHFTTGSVAMWLMDGATISSDLGVGIVGDQDWSIQGARDFNGDGKSDILWRHGTTGSVAMWLMDVATISSDLGVGIVSDEDWEIRETGDFNGDGKADILWRHETTGSVAMWLMDGATISSDLGVGIVSDPAWEIQKAGDFNGDGKADILWRHGATGSVAIWLMDGATISSDLGVGIVSDLGWQIQEVGDFDGDGMADILWRHSTTGSVAIWLMDGATISSDLGVGIVSDLDWWIQGAGDFNGDGKFDILWRRGGTTGSVAIWLMDGATISSDLGVGIVGDLDWEIKN